MTDLSTYCEGFVAGFVPGLGLGLGLMKMAWEQSERRSRSAALKADVLRYLAERGDQPTRLTH